MSDELLKLDTSKLPKPRSIQLNFGSVGETRMVVSLGSIRSARAWATALGIELKDTDPKCRYITIRQESGTARLGALRVHVVGTEPVPPTQWPSREAAQAAARAGAEVAVASS